MMAGIDFIVDRITMYRLVLYVLIGLLGIAVILAYFKVLAFSPISLIVTTGLLVAMCWATNTILARVFNVAANVESSYITALILALIIDPASTPAALQFPGWAAILAISSKYIFARNNKHIFNPAAIAVVLTSLVLGESASWWVGTASMLPAVLLGGVLVVRKLRQADMVWSFCAAAIAGVSLVSIVLGESVLDALKQLLLQSPLLFFAVIMLTEPLTAPPISKMRQLYGLLVGILFVPQVHVASIYSTPELALVAGNVFSYIVSPKQRFVLRLSKKNRLASGIIDFVFKPAQKLSFVPGQYMEFTLAHSSPDSRGNRRYFTLASSPTEQAVHLGIRFSEHGSSYKNALQRMESGERIIAAQLAGDFTLPRDPARKLVFIAGGIGITPFRSMVKYLLDTRQRRDIVLFYVNRRADEIVYTDVFSSAQAKIGLKAYYILTDLAAIPRNWPGLVGRISEKMVLETIPDFDERMYYISGPPDMVRAAEQVLKQMGVQRHLIKKDFFPGLV